jgi:hypothetical protein
MLNSYLVDMLIREHIAEAHRRAASHARLRGISRPSLADGVRGVIAGLARRRAQLTQRRRAAPGLGASPRHAVTR